MSQLRAIGKDIWGQDTELALPGGGRMPSRATIVRLASGALVVHSPLAIDDELARELDALGEVRWLIAPSCIHWMFVKAATVRYPRARVLAADGLGKKLVGRHAVPFERLPAHGRIEALGDELRVQRVEGAPRLNEHVFFHVGSGSLLVADLMFNVSWSSSFMTRLVLRLAGAYAKPAQSRAWRFFVKDRGLAAESAAGILAWDFDRIVVAHGDVIEERAREHATRALSWMTGASRPLLSAGTPERPSASASRGR